MPRNHPVQDQFEQIAKQLHEEAQTLSDDGKRDVLLHKARKMENASRAIGHWISSPRLWPPS